MSKQKAGTTQIIKRKRVSFSFESADAGEVFLMGDFNNWNPKTHPMKREGNGIWDQSLMIPPGKYEYKFMVDGCWMEDPCNDQRCPNCFGTYNSVIDLAGK
ncbi:MAG: isoamylase early set domain-containing protein [Desulfobacterales bacterium]|nr:isoamylase early set domain-containing protein [Desulfobacterales bacterium]